MAEFFSFPYFSIGACITNINVFLIFSNLPSDCLTCLQPANQEWSLKIFYSLTQIFSPDLNNQYVITPVVYATPLQYVEMIPQLHLNSLRGIKGILYGYVSMQSAYSYTMQQWSGADVNYKYKIILWIFDTDLTHLPLDKMTISQMIFSDAFSWMQSFVFRLQFHWGLFLWV